MLPSRQSFWTTNENNWTTSDRYIIVKETKTTTGAGDDAAKREADERNKSVILKKFVPFINCKHEIIQKQIMLKILI